MCRLRSFSLQHLLHFSFFFFNSALHQGGRQPCLTSSSFSPSFYVSESRDSSAIIFKAVLSLFLQLLVHFLVQGKVRRGKNNGHRMRVCMCMCVCVSIVQCVLFLMPSCVIPPHIDPDLSLTHLLFTHVLAFVLDI